MEFHPAAVRRHSRVRRPAFAGVFPHRKPAMWPAMRHLLLISAIALCACPKNTGTGTGTGTGPKIEAKKDASADEALTKALTVAQSKSRREGIEALLSVRKAFPESTAGQDALYRAGEVISREDRGESVVLTIRTDAWRAEQLRDPGGNGRRSA